MPRYLVQCAYTPESWAAQLKNPQSRVDVVRPALEKVGARIESAWFAFGDYDLVLIVEAPDNASAAAVAVAVTAAGGMRSYKTTPLMAIEEGLEALRKGAEVAAVYRPPAG
jgi:uncharacterized protein with GYD domain